MKESTIAALLALNRALYSEHAGTFSATRQKPWRGWKRLVEQLPADRALRVLDAGCGNGRFGIYLGDRAGRYTGIDESAPLLEHARNKLPHATLLRSDLISWTPEENETHDLAVAFGVLHHLPTLRLREELLGKLARVAELVAVTFWSFDPKKAVAHPLNEELEEGDHLLTFGQNNALRYCHLASEQEIDHLIQSTGMTVRDRYTVDDGDQNRYLLLVR